MNGLLINLLLILCVCYEGLVEGANNIRPNIIMIIADDLGWNDVGFHGADDVQTPNIDALAFHGISLYRHYSLPTCTPSRAALLTGKYPIRIGIHGPFAMGKTEGIPLNETLLPQHLKSLGYQTHLIGKWHLGYSSKEYLPTNRGFDSHFGYYAGYIGYYDGMHISPLKMAGLDMWRNEKPAWSEIAGEYATQVFTKEAIKIIEEHDKTSPLFLEVAHLAAHAGNTNGRLQVSDVTENEETFGYIKDHNRRLFAGMVKELDDSVGNIITALDKNNLLDNSIIVFISDNGAPSHEPLWHTTNYGSNWPLRGEKCSLHEGGIRTVGAIWSPKLANPSSVYKNVFHICDWLPTIVRAAGGDSSKLNNIDGINQWEKIINNTDKQKKGEVLDEDNRTILLDINENEALISGKWKIIKNNPYSQLAFANNFYGGKKDFGIPDYNLTAVTTSPTANALNKIKKPEVLQNTNEIEKDNEFLQLRLSNQIHCNNFIEVKMVGNCTDDYCLYNLEDDPCEKINLHRREPNKLNELLIELNYYKNFVVQVESKKFDMNSHPKYWDNYWSPWIILTDKSNNANTLDIIHTSYITLFLFLYTYFIIQ